MFSVCFRLIALLDYINGFIKRMTSHLNLEKNSAMEVA